MSETLKKVQALVANAHVRISIHGYDELAEDGILVTDVLAGLSSAQIVEDYPNFAKGPCVLVLQRDSLRQPVHALWGIAKDTVSPAVLITAYRPDQARWSSDFLQRKP